MFGIELKLVLTTILIVSILSSKVIECCSTTKGPTTVTDLMEGNDTTEG